jgi:putative transcriptional regulator
MSDRHHSLKNNFLVAMPTMDDAQFEQAVIYICEHTLEGSMGIIINHPLDWQLGDLAKDMDLVPSTPIIEQIPIYDGGPLRKERGFVLHSTSKELWDHTVPLTPDLSITTSADILHAICAGKGPENSLIALGYAEWDAGQLEQEIRENLWLHVPGDTHFLFDAPRETCWRASGALLGVDVCHITTEAGHA